MESEQKGEGKLKSKGIKTYNYVVHIKRKKEIMS